MIKGVLMRCHIAAIFIVTLLFRGSWTAAASVEIKLVGASERTVEANIFNTVGFIVTSHDESEQNFILTVDPSAHAVLISTPDPIVLKPGESQRTALTFSISGDVKDRQIIPVSVAIAAAGNPSITARASLAFVVESKVCATIGNQPAAVEISNAGNTHRSAWRS